ncbi:BMP family ABC transporter substrate-binding protein [Azohydromonas australica]|uniref:BMP family ABC transporter substrate-binding protein n=1 Tax=Azohydromonas australica TaxID=364039 RepID=UPI0003FF48A5|nr:BMP family ABC transporter substrate-binding protein [Azohydromonas australica]
MKSFKKQHAVVMALLIASASIASAQQSAKVGFIYHGPVGDAGWTYQHDLGRQEMEKNLGSKVVVRIVPNTLEGPDGERVARELSSDGAKMIFAVGFGYMKPVLKVAAENPDKAYATATAYMTAPNVGGYNAKWHEGGYLAGIVAGKTTKSNIIGFVGAHPVPDVMWYLNGFILGARSVNPKATVRSVFVGSWSDPPKESDAATALINTGADVMTHYTNSPAVVTAADSRGVASISFHSDMRKYAPKHYLTGVTHNWGSYYTQATTEALAGKWKGSLYFGGVKEGVIRLAPFGTQVPKDVADLVAAKTKDIAEGRLNVFAGPIKDNTGTVRVPAGSNLPDAELGKMTWYAEGIQNSAR